MNPVGERINGYISGMISPFYLLFSILRYAAHRMNGKQSVPCIVRNVPLKLLRRAGRSPETRTLPCEVGTCITGVPSGSTGLLRSHFEC